MSSLRRGHANLLCIVPILVYVPPKRVHLWSLHTAICNNKMAAYEPTCQPVVGACLTLPEPLKLPENLTELIPLHNWEVHDEKCYFARILCFRQMCPLFGTLVNSLCHSCTAAQRMHNASCGKYGTLHEFACHPCAGANANLLCMVPTLFQFQKMCFLQNYRTNRYQIWHASSGGHVDGILAMLTGKMAGLSE